MVSASQFRKSIWSYYRVQGRHDMPWRKTKDPYRILVSEVMLQQTQVGRVTRFYKKFVKQFPDFKTLAQAKMADVLGAWQGLGYNRRALSLQKLAQVVMRDHRGKLPRDRAALEALPGIGRGTSGSLMAFAFNEPVVFVETNIRRVFLHHFFQNRQNVADAEIEPFIARALDQTKPKEWYWALMDYGAMLGEKARIRTKENPNVRSKHYVHQPRFTGSDRELRGKLLKLFLKTKKVSPSVAARLFKEPVARVKRISEALSREGFW